MKRSEMIDLMIKSAKDHMYREDAEAALDAMEKAGMLPPPFTKMTSTPVWIDDSPEEGHYEDVPFDLTLHEWEPE